MVLEDGSYAGWAICGLLVVANVAPEVCVCGTQFGSTGGTHYDASRCYA